MESSFFVLVATEGTRYRCVLDLYEIEQKPMAKRNNDPASPADKAKVRVFFAEVEGNNDSIQEALKTMVSAMSRPVRIIHEQKNNGKSEPLLETATDSEEFDDIVDQESDSSSEEDASTSPNLRKPRGAGKKVDRNAGLELVPNLNFRPTSHPSLKEFIEQKGPKNDVEMVMAFLYYMQQVMMLAKIGPSHIMTAFKDAGKAIPVDLKQTIRNIKKNKMWLNFTDIDDLRTTTQGDNFVEHDMGKSE